MLTGGVTIIFFEKFIFVLFESSGLRGQITILHNFFYVNTSYFITHLFQTAQLPEQIITFTYMSDPTLISK